eukprot:TRINITY_DN1603_c0_g1_i8.p1 TRINITY_DN1603_c0_g1~~TRINITY_DN1603_c0_g1_i8.p1  ORF type:complete len:104 (+),score=24.03 TRINITY_DN1603_c0_g1_i8:119-430(+)
MLDDEDTLEDYGVQDGAIIYCVIKPVTNDSVLVKLEDGTSFEINFRLSDTVQKIKRVISERAYGKRCRLSLLYKGESMRDGEELKKYKLKNKEEVTVIRSYTC